MGRILTFEEILPILVSPISLHPVFEENGYLHTNKNEKFPLIDGIPLLYPQEIVHLCLDREIKFEIKTNPILDLLQYFVISKIKWLGGPHNSSSEDHWYCEHLKSMNDLLDSADGMLLDIGCDDPSRGAATCPKRVNYLGLDPLYLGGAKNFKIFGLAEFLPFRNEAFENVCFGTSLDHVLDWMQALEESTRVLKPSGFLYISTLVWSSNAALYKDNVHFHHFREKVLIGALDELNFRVEYSFKKPWKNDSHRKVLYLRAIKMK
jgi:SAM-dependent methyltransferase